MSNVMARLEEIERRLEQMYVRGKVEQVDHKNHRVRVRYGPDSLSGWIEWKPQRSGQVTMWSPPQIGEGCTILSDGDVNRGEVLIGSYHQEMPAPSDNPDETVIVWPDGTRIVYDMAKHEMKISINGQAEVTVAKDAKVKAGGDVYCDAQNIKLNGGAGVVTGAHICQISGKPHADCSSTVYAGK